MDLGVGAAGGLQLVEHDFGRVRPQPVRVRVVALPGDVVDTNTVAEQEPRRVGDETRERVLTEDLARELAAEVVSEPLLVPEVTITAIEEARDPDDARFRPRELEVGIRAEHGTPHQVLRGEHRDLVREDDQVVDRSVGGRDDRTEALVGPNVE